MERVLGPEHPDTLASRNNLTTGYRALGRNSEADELEGDFAKYLCCPPCFKHPQIIPTLYLVKSKLSRKNKLNNENGSLVY